MVSGIVEAPGGAFAFGISVAAVLAVVSSAGAMPIPTGASARAQTRAQSPAPAHIYWTEPSGGKYGPGPGVDTIWRANLDGTGVNRNFIRSDDYLTTIAVDGTHLYWDDSYGIDRARIDGTHVQRGWIPRGGPALAVTRRFIYWNAPGPRAKPPWRAEGVWREHLDGSHRQWVAALGRGWAPTGLAIEGGYVYWTRTDNGTIGRVEVNGTHANRHFITGLNDPAGLAASNGFLYWANRATGESSIGRASVTGSGVQKNFITGVSYPFGVAVGAGHLYWADEGAGTIGRARLDGTHVKESFINARPAVSPEYGNPNPLFVAVGP